MAGERPGPPGTGWRGDDNDRIPEPGVSWEVVSWQPPQALRGSVIRGRGYHLQITAPRRQLEVPVGLVTLVFGWDGALRLCSSARLGPVSSLASMVSGVHTTATLGEYEGCLRGIEVMLTPSAAYRVLGLPLHHVADSNVDLAAACGSDAARLADRLGTRTCWADRFQLLERWIHARLDAGPEPSPTVAWLWSWTSRNHGRIDVQQMAAEVGWSRRHLEDQFHHHVGISPKAAARMWRLRHALGLLAAGHPAAIVAQRCGFYDQAHLNRDIKNMIGCTPGEFLRRRRLALTPPIIDRLPRQVTSIAVGP